MIADGATCYSIVFLYAYEAYLATMAAFSAIAAFHAHGLWYLGAISVAWHLSVLAHTYRFILDLGALPESDLELLRSVERDEPPRPWFRSAAAPAA
jgi:hypothetical protein